MTRCTSSINDHSLNGIAFRASIGLDAQKMMTHHTPELVPRHSVIDAHRHQFMRNDAKHSHLAALSAEAVWRFPHSARPDPTASS
jgi:hypothetical protein